MKNKILNFIFYAAAFALCCSLSIIVNQLFSEQAMVIATIVAAASIVILIIVTIITIFTKNK